MAPPTDGVSLRTSNRNFEGRSGTPSGRVFLVSPETAVFAALHGRIMDATAQDELACPRVRLPKAFDVDDSMFIAPAEDPDPVDIVRGPGIGGVPRNDPLPDALKGVAAIKVGDAVTTDHIMPAGARLKHRSNTERYATFVFEAVDPDFARRAAESRDKGLHNVIVAGESYGQGSSREHAALCPMTLGVKAVVAKSIERIHLANLVNFGIVPFVFKDGTGYDAVEQGDELCIEGVRQALEGDGACVVRNVSRGADIPVRASLSPRQAAIILAGGLLNTATDAGRGPAKRDEG
jgi:aconitate hydratase